MIVKNTDEEIIKEADYLFDEAIQIPTYQNELMESVSNATIAQILMLNELKVSLNTVKCLANRQKEVYDKIVKSTTQEMISSIINGVFSSSISLSEHCCTLVITVTSITIAHSYLYLILPSRIHLFL